jgi:uncharacterized membrane protein YeiH
MPGGAPFQLPISFEVAAVFMFGITGALAGIERRYDVVGVFVIALISATGGGLLRDSVFLAQGIPQVLQNADYLYAVALATVVCLIGGNHLTRFRIIFLLVDAAGLGIYAVVGTQRALGAGLPVAAAACVGLVNAVGGGVLRDVLTGRETLLIKPGEFYVMAAAIGTAVFLSLLLWLHLPATDAAWWSIAATFLIRVAAVRFNWKTREVRPLLDRTLFDRPQ